MLPKQNRSSMLSVAGVLHSIMSPEATDRKARLKGTYIHWYRRCQYAGVVVTIGGILLITISWFTELRHVRQLGWLDTNFLISTAFGLFLLFNILYNYLHCAFTDACVYPKQTNDPNWLNILPAEVKPLCCAESPPNPAHWTPCWICEHWRPPHTHHCAACNVCVVGMDHHCPWVANCVGRNNIREYILFLFWMSLGTIYYLTFCFMSVGPLKFGKAMAKIFRVLSPGGGIAILFAMQDEANRMDPNALAFVGFTHEEYELVFIFFTCAAAVAGFLFVFFLLWQQFSNFSTGQSSIEYWQNVKLQMHKRTKHSERWEHCSEGFRPNFAQAMRCAENELSLMMIFPKTLSIPSFSKRRAQQGKST